MVCVYMCAYERKREREGGRERERGRERECVPVHVVHSQFLAYGNYLLTVHLLGVCFYGPAAGTCAIISLHQVHYILFHIH